MYLLTGRLGYLMSNQVNAFPCQLSGKMDGRGMDGYYFVVLNFYAKCQSEQPARRFYPSR